MNHSIILKSRMDHSHTMHCAIGRSRLQAAILLPVARVVVNSPGRKRVK